jgi:hypothetical protein
LLYQLSYVGVKRAKITSVGIRLKRLLPTKHLPSHGFGVAGAKRG